MLSMDTIVCSCISKFNFHFIFLLFIDYVFWLYTMYFDFQPPYSYATPTPIECPFFLKILPVISSGCLATGVLLGLLAAAWRTMDNLTWATPMK